MSRHPTFEAPLPSSHDELFFIKFIHAFHNALNSIRTSRRSKKVPVGQLLNQTRTRSIKMSGNIVGENGRLLTRVVDQSTPDSGNQLELRNRLLSASIEGVALFDKDLNQSQDAMLNSSNYLSSLEGVNSCSLFFSQSQASLKNRILTFSPQVVVFSCFNSLDQSQPVMQMRYAKPEFCARNHCLRPHISESSLEMNTS